MRELFAYGTLMSSEVCRAVCGEHLKGEPATLDGYTRYRLQGECYPGLLPRRGDEVRGVLYRKLRPQLWRRLDDFEGVLYRREVVTVRLGSGEPVTAHCYLLQPRRLSRLSREPWDYDGFVRHHLGALLGGQG